MKINFFSTISKSMMARGSKMVKRFPLVVKTCSEFTYTAKLEKKKNCRKGDEMNVFFFAVQFVVFTRTRQINYHIK